MVIRIFITDQFSITHERGYLDIFLSPSFLGKPVEVYLEGERLFRTSRLKRNNLFIKLPSEGMLIDIPKLVESLEISVPQS